jgi:hypothetical protein
MLHAIVVESAIKSAQIVLSQSLLLARPCVKECILAHGVVRPVCPLSVQVLIILTATLSYEFLPGCWTIDTASNENQEWPVW